MFLKSLIVASLLLALGFIAFLKNFSGDSPEGKVRLASKLQPSNLEIEDKTSGVVSPSLFAEVALASSAAEVESVAVQFEQAIQYPSFSMPIWDADSLKKYIPNQSSEISFDHEGMSVSLSMSAYQYGLSESVTGQVSANSIESNLHITLQQNGIELARLYIGENDPQPYRFVFDGLLQRIKPGQALVVVHYDVEQEEQALSAPIEMIDVSKATSQLIDVGEAFVTGPWLQIPVEVGTMVDGFFRLEANLYSQTTGRALVHLSQEAELISGNNDIVLSAHFQALKAMNDEGPYLLKNFALSQMPSDPDYETKPGKYSISEAVLPKFSFSNYLDEPYVDEEALARLEFLQQLNQ